MTLVSYPIPEANGELLLVDDERIDQFCAVFGGKRYGKPLTIMKDVSVDGSPWLALHGPAEVAFELGYRTPAGLCIDIPPEQLRSSGAVPLESSGGQFIGYLVPAGAPRPAAVVVREAPGTGTPHR